MANVDFTNPAWDEVDASGKVTVAAAKVSWVGLLSRDEVSHVSDSAAHQGVSLAGDFTHKFECQLDNVDGNSFVTFWGAFENVGSLLERITADDDILNFFHYQDDMYVRVHEAGEIINSDSALALTEGTTYFVTIAYNATTKTLTADIHTGAHHPGGSHIDLLSAAGSAGVTVAHIMALASYDTSGGGGGVSSDGFIQNLDLGEAVVPLTVNVNDGIGVADVGTLALTLFLALVFSLVGVIGNVDVDIPALEINVADTVGVAEDITPQITPYEVELDDGIGLDDSGLTGWKGITSSDIDSLCGEEAGGTLADALDGTDVWDHNTNEVHWFILDLGQSYNVTKVRARSQTGDDPLDVDIYVSDINGTWGTTVASGINDWVNTSAWVETNVTNKSGRYVYIVINDTEDSSRRLDFGRGITTPTIFDVYVENAAVTVVVDYVPNVSDSIGVEDVATLSVISNIPTDDDASVEDVSTIVADYGVQSSDTPGVAEDVSVEILVLEVNVNDAIGITEGTDVEILILEIYAYDDIGLTDWRLHKIPGAELIGTVDLFRYPRLPDDASDEMKVFLLDLESCLRTVLTGDSYVGGVVNADAAKLGDVANYTGFDKNGILLFAGRAGLLHGCCYGDHIGWSQASAGQTTWYPISDASVVSGYSKGITHSDGQLTVTYAGRYMVFYNLTYEANAANKHIDSGIEISDSGTPNLFGRDHAETKFANQEEHLGGSAVVNVVAGGTINIMISTLDTGTPNLAVQNINIQAFQIGGLG